jgi:DNA-binding transcriptional regulator YhcF (GntR family)
MQKIGGALGNFAIGAGKGAISTAASLGGIIQKTLNPASATIAPLDTKRIKEKTAPVGTTQKVGFVAEQIAEFFLPMSKVAKAEKAIDVALQGSRVAKVAAKAGVEALAGGGITYAQTGDIKEAGKSALLFGGTKAATSSVGEALKATRLPERLYSRIFKNSYKDMTEELKTQGVQVLAKKNPEAYQKLVDAGIVRTAIGGKPVINETLAKEALNRGLKGSIENMSNTVIADTLEQEYNAQKIVKGFTSPVTVPKASKLVSVLEETAARYENVGDGAMSTEALKLARSLSGGSLSAKDALTLRRFLDGMRVRSSFDTTAKTLSQGQENFKYWSDTVRGLLKKIPGMEKTMNDYRFDIEALETLAKEASRRGNNQLISLIDSIFLSGFAMGNPGVPVTLGLTRRALNSPSILTRLGSSIENAGTLSKTGLGIKASTAVGTRANE